MNPTKAKRWVSQNSIWVVLIFMVVLMTVLSPAFLTAKNIVSVLTTESITGILTVGVMWCILSKGIDLSPGALVALTGVVTSSLAQKFTYGASRLFPNLPDIPVVVAIAAGLAVGTFFGLINGLLIAYTKIPAFIATLGTQLIARALAQLYTNAYPIPELKPAFKKDGTVTAANASGINDGAAALVIMTAEKAKELGVKPMAKFVAGASAGVDPSIMGVGPVYATRKVLKKAGMDLDQIDLIEANEAFAAQSVAVANELGLDKSKVNVNGGAIALGHPIGASGCRILVTLLYELKHSGKKTGLATLCIGGGMGVATIVEAL